ncbi:hypothetical protein BT96DRAFT_1096964, partial [Gymnopus androsaceus JB14]
PKRNFLPPAEALTFLLHRQSRILARSTLDPILILVPHLHTIPGTGRSNSSQTLIGIPSSTFAKVDHTLGNVIDILEREETSVGGSEDENELLRRFRTVESRVG